MPLPNPSLDDKTFEDILGDAKRHLLIHSGRWTNHNVSDPGITLLELFCWLADNQIYKLNRIGQKNILKFLKLLGEQPQKPIPEKLVLSFITKKPTKIPCQTVLVNMNNPDDLYRLENNLTVHPISVKKILTKSSSGLVNQTEILGKTPIAVFGVSPAIGNSFLIGIDGAKIVSSTVDFFITLHHVHLDRFPFGNHCNFDKFYPSSSVKWQYLTVNKDGKKKWRPLEVIDGTVSLTKSGIVSIQIPFDKMKKLDIDNSNESLFWISCRFNHGHYETPPKIKTVNPNSVFATKGHEITEKLGTSTGLADQRFSLAYTPIIDVISVTSGQDSENWKEVDDFDSSGPDDMHYVVDSDIIYFGNGVNGDIPSSGSVISATYRYGTPSSKSKKPHVMPKDVQSFQNIIGVDAIVHNAGKPGESINNAVLRTVNDQKKPFKLVNNDDWISITEDTPGIRIARVSAFNDPDNNLVTVVVIPYSTQKNPQPSQGFLDTVREHLEEHRLLTTQIKVMGPNYVRVDVAVDVYVSDYANSDNIKRMIIDALDSLFDPVSEDGGWPFGRPIYKSGVYSTIKAIDGVEYVGKPYIRASGKQGTFGYSKGMMIIDDTSVVYSGQHSVRIKSSKTIPQNRRQFL